LSWKSKPKHRRINKAISNIYLYWAVTIMNKNILTGCVIALYLMLTGINAAFGIPVAHTDSNGVLVSDHLPSYELGPRIWFNWPEFIINSTETLKAYNIDINDINNIETATTSNKSYIRSSAYHLLALKEGAKAISILKNGLNDKELSIHFQVARFLALLGDKSGLEKLKEEIKLITDYDGLLNDTKGIKYDPNEKGTPPLGLSNKKSRLSHCLGAAIVLSEFGDSYGYELAVQQALDEKGFRMDAVSILANLSRIDKAKQQTKGIDPESIILRVLDTEKDKTNLEMFFPSIVGAKMKPESQIKIYDKFIKSPYLSDKSKQIYGNKMQQLQKQIEKEKQVKAQENTQQLK
jgi:hypothetical protein